MSRLFYAVAPCGRHCCTADTMPHFCCCCCCLSSLDLNKVLGWKRVTSRSIVSYPKYLKILITLIRCVWFEIIHIATFLSLCVFLHTSVHNVSIGEIQFFFKFLKFLLDLVWVWNALVWLFNMKQFTKVINIWGIKSLFLSVFQTKLYFEPFNR